MGFGGFLKNMAAVAVHIVIAIVVVIVGISVYMAPALTPESNEILDTAFPIAGIIIVFLGMAYFVYITKVKYPKRRGW